MPIGRFTAQVTVFMFVPLRTAFTVIAALSAASVAPAQVNPAAEPLIAEGPLPAEMEVIPLPGEEAADPLAPLVEPADPQDEAIKPGATLAETVASLQG